MLVPHLTNSLGRNDDQEKTARGPWDYEGEEKEEEEEVVVEGGEGLTRLVTVLLWELAGSEVASSNSAELQPDCNL